MPVEGIHMFLLHVWTKNLQFIFREFIIEFKDAGTIFLIDGGITFCKSRLVYILLELIGNVILCCQAKDGIRETVDILLLHIEIDRRFCISFASKVCYSPAFLVLLQGTRWGILLSDGKVLLGRSCAVFLHAFFSVRV